MLPSLHNEETKMRSHPTQQVLKSHADPRFPHDLCLKLMLKPWWKYIYIRQECRGMSKKLLKMFEG